MTQDVLLRRGSTATLVTTGLTALTVSVTGLACTSSLGEPVVSVSTPMASLVDGFSGGALDTDLWTTTIPTPPTGTAGTVVVSGGVLTLTPDTYGDLATGITSKQRYDLTGGSLVVQLAKVPSGGYAYLTLRDATELGYLVQVFAGLGKLWVGVARGSGMLVSGYYTGTDLWSGDIATFAPSGQNGCWLKVAESGGSLTVSTAPLTADNPPSGGDWTVRVTDALPVGWNVGALRVALRVASEGDYAPVIWDAVNTTASGIGASGDQDLRVRAGPAGRLMTPAFNAAVSGDVLLDGVTLVEATAAMGQVVVRSGATTLVPVSTSLLVTTAVETNYAFDQAVELAVTAVSPAMAQPASILGDTQVVTVAVLHGGDRPAVLGTPTPICTALTVSPAGLAVASVAPSGWAVLRANRTKNQLTLRQQSKGAD